MDFAQGQACDISLAIDALKRDWLKRQLQGVMEEVVLGDGDPVLNARKAMQEISALTMAVDGGKLEVTSLKDSMLTLAEGNPLLSPEMAANKIRFGIWSLDNAIRMGSGRLGIVAAMASAGKSSLVIQAGQESAKAGHRTLTVSLEMDREEVDAKRVANWTGREAWKITNNQKKMTFDNDLWEASSLCLNINCGAGQDWFELESKIKAIHASTPLDAVFIDYFTLLDPPEKRRGENSAQSYGHISKGAKMLAKELGACVVLVSQFNREVDEGLEPKLKNLRETGQLENDCDWAVLMWNSRGQFSTTSDLEQRLVACRIAKNRGGKRGDLIHLVFTPSINRFEQAEIAS
jgi:replicative DNA helicase